MKEMTIKKVAPAQLPSLLCFQLNYLYHTELGKFAAIYDKGAGVLYVNVSIPDEDVEKFVRYVSFSGQYINMDESEGGLCSCQMRLKRSMGVTSGRSCMMPMAVGRGRPK